MQGGIAQAEGTSAIANADSSSSWTDIYVDVHATHRQHTQTHTEQIDDRSDHVLATDRSSVPTECTTIRQYRYTAFVPATTVGPHAIHRPARRLRRSVQCTTNAHFDGL